LDGISLEVAEKELLGLSGPSGAGKSTFYQSLSGLQNLGVPRHLMRERIAEAPDLVGLHGLEKRVPSELSGRTTEALSRYRDCDEASSQPPGLTY
jgi:energy-coupling factor transporter ATP-binding protein EcfA2